MEGFGVDVINSSAETLLFFLIPTAAIVAIAWHVQLTRSMAFVDFSTDQGSESLRAKCLLRFLVPLFTVMAVCGILLPFAVILSSESLRYYLDDTTLHQFVLFPYNWVLPINGWLTTISFDAVVGAAIYLAGGLLLWAGHRLSGR